MTPCEKGWRPKPLDSRIYSRAQCLAAEGKLPDDHPSWRQDSSPEGERRQEQIRDTQRRLVPYLAPGKTAMLSDLIRQATGQPTTDSTHDGAWQIRRAVFAWVDAGRAEWVDGSLDYFRFLAPPISALVGRPVPAPRAAESGIVGSCDCGARWRGELVCHCATCHLTFTSIGPFDEHRIAGRCRTTAELTKRGLEPNVEGQWRRPRPLDTIPRRRSADDATTA